MKFLKFEKQGSLLLFILRMFILYFLLFHLYLYLKDTLDFMFVNFMFLISAGFAILLEKVKLRFPTSILIFLFFFWLSRQIVFLFFKLQQNLFSSPEIDFQFFFFDTNFLPLIIPGLIIWLFVFLAARDSRFILWETGLNAGLFTLLFWSQGKYDITLYSHQGFLAIAVTVFILTEVSILFIYRKKETLKEYENITDSIKKTGRKDKANYPVFLLIILPLLIIVFIFLNGRYTEGAVTEGGGLMKPTFFRFDFSKYIKLESEISMSNDLVLLFRKEGRAENILLRRFVLSGYNPGTGFYFENEPFREANIGEFENTVPDGIRTYSDPEYEGRIETLQEYFLINFDPSSLIAMNYPIEAVPLKNWDSSSFLRIYRILSKVPGFFPWELEEDNAQSAEEEFLDYYTRYGQSSMIRELALEITAGLENYYDKVYAIEDYLLKNYKYSLKPGIAVDGNQLNHFLFNSKKGYCTYFAFSMTLLCRSIGIPARVSVGFFVDPGMEVLNFYPVRADMAHAWVEIFFSRFGWIEFDPTSTELAEGEDFEIAGFQMEEFTSLIEEIIRNENLLEEESEEESETVDLTEQLRIQSLKFVKWILKLWYIIIPVLYLIIILIIRFYPAVMVVLIRNKRVKVKYLFQRALQIPFGMGWIKKGDESILEYAERIHKTRNIDIIPLTKSYLEAVFSFNFPDEDYYNAYLLFRDYKKSLHNRIPFLKRGLAFINPIGILRKKG